MNTKEYLTRQAVADILGVSRPTIYRYVKRGIFPRPDLQIPPNTVRWSKGLVELWIKGNPNLVTTLKESFDEAEDIRARTTTITPSGTLELKEKDYPDENLIEVQADGAAKWTNEIEVLKELLKNSLGLPASTSDKVLLSRTAALLDAIAKFKKHLTGR